MTKLVADNISYTYPRSSSPVFSGISFSAHAGEMLAILGNNGAGKSTLLDLITGLARANEGTVTLNDVDLYTMKRAAIAQQIAYVAQRQSIPRLSVYDEVLLGRKPYISWGISAYDREIVAKTIARLDLEEFARRYCDELSGGERQKIFIARALAQEPSVLVLDEPTSALDPKNQIEVMQIIREETHHEGLATILVLHDINLAMRFCDRFIFIRDGKMVAHGAHDIITSDTLLKTYDTPFILSEVEGFMIALPQE